MTGVEILAMKEVASATEFNWTMFWIIFGCVFFIMFIIGIAEGSPTWDCATLMFYIFLGVVLGLLSGLLVGAITSTPTEYKTEYKVTISDEVSMNDFLSKYEIVDQEGKIYTVRERNEWI